MVGIKCTDEAAYLKASAEASDSLLSAVKEFSTVIQNLDLIKDSLGSNVASAIGVLEQMKNSTDSAQENLAGIMQKIDSVIHAGHDAEDVKLF